MPNTMKIFKTKEDLIKKAEEQALKVEENYRHSVYLYFIARYFVSVHEAKFGTIPIQVWNEYRNALDHFFRHLTNTKDSHIYKMEGHLQRAVLDILKIYSHMVQTEVNKLKEEFDSDILNLVDNGSFLTKLIKDIKDSEDLFIEAKIKDNSLGEDAQTNKEIVGYYLDTVFSFDAIYDYVINKLPDIEQAKRNYESIHHKAEKGAFWEHIKTHYIFYISWTILAGGLQFVYNSGWLQFIYDYFKKMFQS